MAKVTPVYISEKTHLVISDVVRIVLYRMDFIELCDTLSQYGKRYRSLQKHGTSKNIDEAIDSFANNMMVVPLYLKKYSTVESRYDYNKIKEKLWILDYINSRNFLCDVVCSAWINEDFDSAQELLAKYYGKSVTDDSREIDEDGYLAFENRLLSSTVQSLDTKYKKRVLRCSKLYYEYSKSPSDKNMIQGVTTHKDSVLEKKKETLEYVTKLEEQALPLDTSITCLDWLLSLPEDKLKADLQKILNNTKIKNLMCIENRGWLDDLSIEVRFILISNFRFIGTYVSGEMTYMELTRLCINSLSRCGYELFKRYGSTLDYGPIGLTLISFEIGRGTGVLSLLHAFSGKHYGSRGICTEVLRRLQVEESPLSRVLGLIVDNNMEELDKLLIGTNFSREFAEYLATAYPNSTFSTIETGKQLKTREVPIKYLMKECERLAGEINSDGETDSVQKDVNKVCIVSEAEAFKKLSDIVSYSNEIKVKLEKYTRREKMLCRKVDALKDGCVDFIELLNKADAINKTLTSFKNYQTDINEGIKGVVCDD